MNFRVSRQYSDLPSDIITEGIAERKTYVAQRRRVVVASTQGRDAGGERFVGGREKNERFILLNVKFHVGTQL